MDPSRITLREFKLSDAEDVLLWAGDDHVTSSGPWKTLTSKEEASVFIEQHCMPHPWQRSVCIDDRCIGFVAFRSGSDNDKCRGDMGYAIAVKYWGQGITTIALKMAIPLIFGNFPEVVRVQAFTGVDNKASQRVLEKAGFTKEGLLRKYFYLKGNILDVVIFSLLSTDSTLL